jgi:hypothetical protein
MPTQTANLIYGIFLLLGLVGVLASETWWARALCGAGIGLAITGMVSTLRDR